jgi:hypothetical protein
MRLFFDPVISVFLAKHIIKIDGKAGLFNGLAPRLCAGTIGTLVHGRVLQVGLTNTLA